ncbi:group 1 truncated hemoglobin [Massilia violaceinigra]|uniref:Group 1 truncated hemoglobin n=1 Tax=Massilia violaceinigra TaxID=2045208 RepID=A0A2D2DEB0_9BURK|nr:group 1 truncated hemoglobin [Massilia violaceinigra]ATQ73314.1 group 1 truncated hemoglobin [Massilia violaceinigra]
MKTLTRLFCIGTLALASGCAHRPATDDTTYQGLGGQSGIKKIVDTFVPMIMADARIKESFRDTDLKNLSMRLEEQFCELAGGPCKYKGKDMKEIHDGLNITNAQFNALAEDLQAAMDKNGIAPAVQNKLVARLAPMQKEIVTK